MVHFVGGNDGRQVNLQRLLQFHPKKVYHSVTSLNLKGFALQRVSQEKSG